MKVARDFVSGVQRVTSLIARQPGLGAPWNDTRLSAPVRRVPLTRFPYQVISAAILFSWVHLSEIHAGHGSSRHGRRRA